MTLALAGFPSSRTMNRLWQQLGIATNWPVLVAVTVLSALGVCSIWADSRPDAQKQLVFLAISVACMMLFQTVNYQKLGRLSWFFYIASLVLLLYTVVPGVPRSGFGSVPTIKGAHPWIKFGQFSLQPAELTKIAFLMVLARYLRFRSNYRTLAGLVPPFMLALCPIALILKQPDLGTALTFIPALFAMLFVAGARMWHLAAVLAAGRAVAPIMWLAGPAPDGPGLPVLKYLPTMVKPY